jgi:hypothetical protein
MKTCVVCKFYPAAAGESICDDCVKTLPHLVPDQEPEIGPEPEKYTGRKNPYSVEFPARVRASRVA